MIYLTTHERVREVRLNAGLPPTPAYAEDVLGLINTSAAMGVGDIRRKLWPGLRTHEAAWARLEQLELRGLVRPYVLLRNITAKRTEYHPRAVGPNGETVMQVAERLFLELNAAARAAVAYRHAAPNVVPEMRLDFWQFWDSHQNLIYAQCHEEQVPTPAGGNRVTRTYYARGLTAAEWDARVAWGPALTAAIESNDPLPGMAYADWLEEQDPIDFAHEVAAIRSWGERGLPLQWPGRAYGGTFATRNVSAKRWDLLNAIRPDVMPERSRAHRVRTPTGIPGVHTVNDVPISTGDLRSSLPPTTPDQGVTDE